jgi:hypothetical protein
MNKTKRIQVRDIYQQHALKANTNTHFLVGLSLFVTYTPTYPDELPEYEIEALEGQIPSSYLEKIKTLVKAAVSLLNNGIHFIFIDTLYFFQAEESIGMAMIFSMVMVIKEELDNIKLDAQRAEEEVANEKRRKEEEAERAKFTGTKVTLESFMAWKNDFDAELAKKDAEAKAQRARELKGKLTGREMFTRDKSLAMSDAKYMEDDDDTVDVAQFDKEERGGAMEDQEEEENGVWKQFGSDD